MLYAATFSFEKYDSLDASSGTMGALIESDSPEQAVEKLEKLIRETAEDNASLFDGVENIFLDSLIEVKDSIPNGIITNITLFSDMAFQDLAEFNDELDEEVDDDYENEEFEASEEDEDDEDDDDEDDGDEVWNEDESA
ncbi:MAG: hypothetical protein Q4E22_07150, partial [Coriobacteriia bacterium]|nr:hypothetical protein [Coriobacteriia bacterium]